MWTEYIVRGASEELVHCGQSGDLVPRIGDHVALWHVECNKDDPPEEPHREWPADAPTLYLVVDVCWGWDRREDRMTGPHRQALGFTFIPLVYVIVEPSPEAWSPHIL